MAGDIFKHVTPGPVRMPAATMNACIDTAKAFRQFGAIGPNPIPGVGWQPDLVLVKNVSGSDVAQFGVLAVSDALFSTTDNILSFKSRVMLQGGVPASGDQGRFVVTLGPIKNGEVGWACASGCVPVQLDVQDESDLFADVIPGDTEALVTGPSGSAQVLYKESPGSGGLAWGYVRLNSASPSRGAGFWAVLTGFLSLSYAWSEVERVGINTWQILVGGRSGTTSTNPAVEVNEREGIPAGTVVWIVPTIDTDGINTRYDFDIGAGTIIDENGDPLSPVTIGSAPEGSETAETDSWLIANQGGNAGVQVRVTTRVVYNHNGDEKLYGFYRTLQFDANGHLVSISDEGRYEIDAPDDCETEF